MYIRVALYFNEGGKECYFDHFEITFLKIFILVLTSRELNLKKKKGPFLSFFFHISAKEIQAFGRRMFCFTKNNTMNFSNGYTETVF